MTKSLNQDLCSKGLISDLKQAALCNLKTLCRLFCNNCPNVCVNINFKKVFFAGKQPDSLIIKHTENDDLDIYMRWRASYCLA